MIDRAAPLSIATSSSAETQALGASLGALLQPGIVVTLSGKLGAGKTTLVQGIARGNGYNGYVRSPTFVLVYEYQGRLPIAHCDMYRLQPEEADDLGLEDYLEDGVLLAEWPERYPTLANADGLHIKLGFGKGCDERRLELRASGKRAAELLTQLAAERKGA